MKKQYYIDHRPLPLLFIKEYKNAFLLLGGFFLFIIFMLNPKGELSLESYYTLVIFLFAIFLWVTNVIPLAITSLAIMGLLSTFKVLESGQVYSFFGNEAVFFIIGSFIISAGVSTSGLSTRVAYYVLSKFGNQPHRLVLSIFLLATFMSHLIPEHVVGALLFPIVVSVVQELKLKPGSLLVKYMFFALAWGCVIGGVVTFLGGARNPVAIGILLETTGEKISFLEWMIAVAPPVYFIIIITCIMIYKKVSTIKEENIVLQNLYNQKRRIKKIKFNEVKAGIILIGTIYMWIFQSEQFGIANIALLSSALFFILKVISWQDAKKQINWGAIFMYGGAIAIGKSLVETGLLHYFSEKYISYMNIGTLSLILILFVISLFLTEGVSNTAVVVILLPIVLQLALHFGISTKLAVYIVAVPAGLSFLFPMGTPVNALVFTSGYIKLSDTIKAGMLLKLLTILIFTLCILFYWPLIGLK